MKIIMIVAVMIGLGWGLRYLLVRQARTPVSAPAETTRASDAELSDPVKRAFAIDRRFHEVYTPCWEGAYGAIGDAYLFSATRDSSLLRFHLITHPMQQMCAGTWVDDRAWVCLAELIWWDVTGRKNLNLVEDARRRYTEAREEGRLSNIDGYWSWYNYPPSASSSERIFTNSNMNQMATVACWLFQATSERRYLDDALLVWKGDRKYPGIIQTLYKGNGLWQGKPGRAAFGKQLPWEGVEYCSLGARLYQITRDTVIRRVVIQTVERVLDPANGWVDPDDYYQIRMDGNGAFVNYCLDGYSVAPSQLKDVLKKVGIMLDHVWTNHRNGASVTLHRLKDDGIRNGWNPAGGEDGYGVDEVGTVHAQGEAVRAFGIYTYYFSKQSTKY